MCEARLLKPNGIFEGIVGDYDFSALSRALIKVGVGIRQKGERDFLVIGDKNRKVAEQKLYILNSWYRYFARRQGKEVPGLEYELL